MSNISTRMRVSDGSAWHPVLNAWYYDGASWVQLGSLYESGDGTLYPTGTWGGAASTTKYDVEGFPFITVTEETSTAVRVTWGSESATALANYDIVLQFQNTDHALPSYNTTITIPVGDAARSNGYYIHTSAGQVGDEVDVFVHYRNPANGNTGATSSGSVTLT